MPEHGEKQHAGPEGDEQSEQLGQLPESLRQPGRNHQQGDGKTENGIAQVLDP
jgi:hypothetical protein